MIKFFKQKTKPIILILGSHYSGNEYTKYLIELLLKGDIKLKTEQIDSKIDRLQTNFLKSLGFSWFNNLQGEDFKDLPYGWEFSNRTINFKTELNEIFKNFLNPDIILLDEVLAVGDAEFSKKSKEKIKEFKEKGKTIIFVSHDPTSIMEMCDEALYLDNGKIQIIGEPAMVASAYQHIADN
ncbi:MAG: hypothetical protein M0Z72_04810 [Deltaproteobacteria bacterium]|nr:hypothetical protein [Deltaproteobacteria bacterium]